MADDFSAEKLVLVVCPTCHARLHPRRELIGKRVRCPECGVAVRVEEPKPQPVIVRKEPAAAEYQLSPDDQPRVVVPTVKVTCGVCGTHLHPRAELVGKRVRCPDCHRPVLVTPAPKERPVKKPRAVGQYGVGAEPEPVPVPETKFLHNQQVSEPLPDTPPAPRWWFLSGVFSFPWSAGTIAHWGTLSFFSVVANGIAVIALVALPTVSGDFDRGDFDFGSAFMVPATLGLGAIVWGLMMSYTSGCVLTVIRDTAAGNTEISDWSDAQILEGFVKSFCVWLPLAAAAALAYSTYRTVALAAPQAASWSGGGTFVVLFPIMFLSVVEHGSPLVLFSASALRLVFGFFRGWITINVLAAALAGGWLGLTIWGVGYSAIATTIVGAPLFAAVILINARLLGRFLQRAAEVIEAKQQRKREKADPQATAEE